LTGLSSTEGKAAVIAQLQQSVRSDSISIHASEQQATQEFFKTMASEIATEYTTAKSIESVKALAKVDSHAAVV
jgi:ABC-type Zn uptake system ZnuABC Zn-binding protein ZnuA